MFIFNHIKYIYYYQIIYAVLQTAHISSAVDMHCKMNVAARWLIIGVAVVMMTSGWAHPAPDPNRGISDALKYLQELDRIYAHVAMPR